MSDQLLAPLRSGDSEAWDEAFRILYPCAWSAARHPSAGLHPAEAEDIAIETLHQLVPLIQTVDSWAGLKALTVTIAARRAISERRRQSAEKRGGVQSTLSLEERRESGDESVERASIYLEKLEPRDLLELKPLIEQSLDQLEPATRGVIEDFFLHSLSYQEVSEKRGLPIGTVGVNLARGLKKIRARVEHAPKLLKELRDFLR